MQSTPMLLTAEDVAERTNLGRSTIYALLKSGELKSVKVGRARRIPAAALDEFIANLSRTQGAA